MSETHSVARNKYSLCSCLQVYTGGSGGLFTLDEFRVYQQSDPVQYGAQFPATKDGNVYFVPQKASNQLKLTLIVASVFKKQV